MRQINLLIILFLFVNFTSCGVLGDDSSSSHQNYDGSGSVVFDIELDRYTSKGVTTIELIVYDLDDSPQFMATYNIDDIPSRINDINAGPRKTIYIVAKNDSNEVLRRGESAKFNLQADQTVDIGEISTNAFYPSDRFGINPENDANLNDELDIFQWEAVTGAEQYRIRIYTQGLNKDPVVDEITSNTEYQVSNFADLITSPEDQVDLQPPEDTLQPFPDTGQNRSYTETWGEDFDYKAFEPSYSRILTNGCDFPYRNHQGDYSNSKDCIWTITCIDKEGNEGVSTELSFTLIWAMVMDNVTGLIWTVQTDYTVNSYTWQGVRTFINDLNSKSYGGFSNWRMPTIKELSTIINSWNREPAIDDPNLPFTPSANFWSSTDMVDSSNNVWTVNFSDGSFYNLGKEWLQPSAPVPYASLRLVSGQEGSTDYNFIPVDDETIIDETNRLMWQTETLENKNWEEALEYCEGLILNNDGQWTTSDTPNGSGRKYDDWRLPSRNELQTIVVYSNNNPAADPLFSTEASSYWSSTTYIGADKYYLNAWAFDFSSGNVEHSYKDNKHFIRAVRSITE